MEILTRRFSAGRGSRVGRSMVAGLLLASTMA
jgi:hypothetical protein